MNCCFAYYIIAGFPHFEYSPVRRKSPLCSQNDHFPRRFRVPAYQSLVPPPAPALEAEMSAVHRGDGGTPRREYLELWTFSFAQPNPLGKQSEMFINHSQEAKSGSPQHRPSCTSGLP